MQMTVGRASPGAIHVFLLPSLYQLFRKMRPKKFSECQKVEGQEALSSAWVETLYRSIFLDQHG